LLNRHTEYGKSELYQKKNIEKILKFIKLNEEKDKKDNKGRVNETGNE